MSKFYSDGECLDFKCQYNSNGECTLDNPRCKHIRSKSNENKYSKSTKMSKSTES